MSTSTDAVKFMLDNEDRLEPADLIRDFMLQDINGFCALFGEEPLSLIARLAKQDPDRFMKLAEERVNKGGTCREIIAKIISAAYVDAIKLIRSTFGFGLKESKDIADNIRVTLFFMGKLQIKYNIRPALDATSTMIHNQIISFA